MPKFKDAQRFRKVYSYYRPTPVQEAVGGGGVDETVIQALDWKQSALVASVPGENVDLSLGIIANGVSLDGYNTWIDDDRVLLKDQTNPAENGIYLYNASTDRFERAADADTGTLTSGAAIYIEAGAINAGSAYVLTTNDPITVDVTSQTWIKFAGAGSSIFISTTSPSKLAKTEYSVSFDKDLRYPSALGADVYFYVSGSVSGSGVADRKAVFGGDVLLSGSQSQYTSRAVGVGSHAEGLGTVASGEGSHSEGNNTQAIGDSSHVEGISAAAGARFFAASGGMTGGILQLDYSGNATSAFSGGTMWIVGSTYFLQDSIDGVSFDGMYTYVTGSSGMSSGGTLYIVDTGNLRDPRGDTIFGHESHAEGNNTNTLSDYSHAEGEYTKTTGQGSHAEGYNTVAVGDNSHAEGESTLSLGTSAHSEGYGTLAAGDHSHAEGINSIAIGTGSHATGHWVIASGSNIGQNVVGMYNLRGNTESLFTIGDGTGDTDVDRHDLLNAKPGILEVSGTLSISGSLIGNGGFDFIGDLLEITGTLSVTDGISGSLTTLADGTSYLIASGVIEITSASGGAITIYAPNIPGQIFSKGFFYGTSQDAYGNIDLTSIGALMPGYDSERDIDVFLNGQLLTATDDYFMSSSTLLHVSSTLNPMDIVTVRMLVSSSETPPGYYSPGGGDTQVQFKDGGSFGGDAAFTFNKTTKVVTTHDLLPAADVTYDLGSSANRWANIYTGDLHLKNDRGDWTIVEEEEYLCVINNKTGKRFKMHLIPMEE